MLGALEALGHALDALGATARQELVLDRARPQGVLFAGDTATAAATAAGDAGGAAGAAGA